jgi:hypothetical protein
MALLDISCIFASDALAEQVSSLVVNEAENNLFGSGQKILFFHGSSSANLEFPKQYH